MRCAVPYRAIVLETPLRDFSTGIGNAYRSLSPATLEVIKMA